MQGGSASVEIEDRRRGEGRDEGETRETRDAGDERREQCEMRRCAMRAPRLSHRLAVLGGHEDQPMARQINLLNTSMRLCAY